MSHPYFTYPRSTPWFSWEEWRNVHQGLYSQNPSEVYWALDMVECWMLRGRCPHSVETTAHLASYLLKSASYTSMEARLLASTIIVRAVNGLVEPLQQRAHVDSVMSLAAKLGIPPWIVELRHAATHDKLPSLANLRLAASTLLNWLNESYWQPQSNKLQQLHDGCLQFLQPRSEEQLLLEGYPQPQRITSVVDSVTAVSSIFAPAVVYTCIAHETSAEWLAFILQCVQRLEQVWGSALSACAAQAFDKLFVVTEAPTGGNAEEVEAQRVMALLRHLEPSIRASESAARILDALQHRWNEIMHRQQGHQHQQQHEIGMNGIDEEVAAFVSSYLKPDPDAVAMPGANDDHSKADEALESELPFEECQLPLWPLGSMPGQLSSSLHLVTYHDQQEAS